MQGKKSLVCSLLHCSAAESPLVLEGHSHVLVPLYASLPTRGSRVFSGVQEDQVHDVSYSGHYVIYVKATAWRLVQS